MPDRPPLAVLVGGAPGSGKTTLADHLGQALDLPVLHKDLLVHGRWRTLDRATELGGGGVELFYRSMELWLDLGVSFVAEQAFYRGVSEPDVASRLAPCATVVLVHCRAENAKERWRQRMEADPLCGPNRLRSLLPVIDRLDAELVEPLDFGCPTIVVRTDDGYDPPLQEIVATIDALYSRPLVHDLDHDLASPRPSGSASDQFLKPSHHPSSRSRGSSIPKWCAISCTTTR